MNFKPEYTSFLITILLWLNPSWNRRANMVLQQAETETNEWVSAHKLLDIQYFLSPSELMSDTNTRLHRNLTSLLAKNLLPV